MGLITSLPTGEIIVSLTLTFWEGIPPPKSSSKTFSLSRTFRLNEALASSSISGNNTSTGPSLYKTVFRLETFVLYEYVVFRFNFLAIFSILVWDFITMISLLTVLITRPAPDIVLIGADPRNDSEPPLAEVLIINDAVLE